MENTSLARDDDEDQLDDSLKLFDWSSLPAPKATTLMYVWPTSCGPATPKKVRDFWSKSSHVGSRVSPASLMTKDDMVPGNQEGGRKRI